MEIKEELGACFIVTCVCEVGDKWTNDFGQSPDVSQVSSDVGKKREVWKRSGFGCLQECG